MSEVVVAIDPGRDKCGFAVVAMDGHVLDKAVVSVDALPARVTGVTQVVEAYALGDGTATGPIRERLVAAGIPDELIVLVDEYKSSEIGRTAYWRQHPPRGWRRFIPTGLQVPPVAYDDFVAVELARRYLASGGNGGKRVPQAKGRNKIDK